jgi:hypothetical protein
MRKIILFLAIAAAHVAATIVCGVAEVTTGGFVFSSPSSTHSFWSVALKIFEFPLLTISRARDSMDPPFYTYIMSLNSFVWTSVIVLGIRVLKRRPVMA